MERLDRQKPGSVPRSEPFALVAKGPHGLRVSAVNHAARAAGVATGASLPDVRAALPALRVRPAEMQRDREALVSLAHWLGRYGPATNVDGADGAWVDVTGVPHLFGGEERLCADLAARLRALGFSSRIGLADTFGTARALARFGVAEASAAAPWRIAPPNGAKVALAGLPVAALRLEPDAARMLVRLGLKRIGQLYGLPRAALAVRFRQDGRASRRASEGAAAALLLRLDQALGLVGEPRRPIEALPEASSRLAFAEPLLTAEGIEQALAELAGNLASSLARQNLGARRFRLLLYRSDGTRAEIAIGTSAPCRDARHLCCLLTMRLDGLDAGFGIDAATLGADRLEPLAAAQVALGTETSGDTTALVDRLASRLGRSRVLACLPCESHVPERAEIWAPVMDAGLPDRNGEGCGPRIASPATAPLPLPLPPRPPLLLAPPEPIAVLAEVPEGAPQRFVWRRLARRIVRSEGPERIAPEWWRHIGVSGSTPGTRDYYRVEDTTGARYWVFREGLYGEEGGDGEDTDAAIGRLDPGPRWFVHGLFP
ncbi:MAG: DNA polymerase Y family protein [Hyphomicrobiaceae bacterium]